MRLRLVALRRRRCLGDRGEVLGRCREVVEASGVASLGVEPVERPSEALEPVALVERAAHMDQRPREPTPGLLVDRAARAARWPRVPTSGDPRRPCPSARTPPPRAAREQPVVAQLVERRQDLAARQVAGHAEDARFAPPAARAPRSHLPRRRRYRRISAFVEASCWSPRSPRRELGRDAAGEGLAELDTHWSNGSTSQIAACTEDLVLVQRDELAERRRGESLTRIVVVGRRRGTWGTCSGGTPSASTSAAVRPKARASA